MKTYSDIKDLDRKLKTTRIYKDGLESYLNDQLWNSQSEIDDIVKYLNRAGERSGEKNIARHVGDLISIDLNR